MRHDDIYEFIGTWDDQFKRVGFESDIEGRPIERLIRCKDCKHAKCIEQADDWWECDYDNRVLHGDDYCSWAERKEENE